MERSVRQGEPMPELVGSVKTQSFGSIASSTMQHDLVFTAIDTLWDAITCAKVAHWAHNLLEHNRAMCDNTSTRGAHDG